jgi:hypothetical protein
VTAESLPSDPSVIEFSGAPDRFRDRYLARCGAACSLQQAIHIAPSERPYRKSRSAPEAARSTVIGWIRIRRGDVDASRKPMANSSGRRNIGVVGVEQ